MNNRTFSKLLLIFCSIVAFSNSYSQGYQRLFNDSERDIINTCNTPAAQGGYYLVNFFNGPSTAQPDSIGILVSKHTLKGDLVWSYDYMIDDATYSLSTKVLECERNAGDTLMVVAIDASSEQQEGKKYLLQIDPLGQMIWNIQMTDIDKSTNTTAFTSYAKVIEGIAADVNYFGTHNSGDTTGVHLERIDSTTSTISRTFYGMTIDSISPELVNLNLVDAKLSGDSTFIVSMATPLDPNRAAIMRLDSVGMPFQAQTYQIADSIKYGIEFTSIVNTPDKGYVAVGNCNHNFLFNGIVVKLDSALNVSWARRINTGLGSFNQAQDVVISALGQIVVAGKSFDGIEQAPSNYTAFLNLDGVQIIGARYESDNTLYAEGTSGLASVVNISNVSGMEMLLSTTGANSPPSGLAPQVIRLTQMGEAMCHDEFFVGLDTLIFEIDTLGIELGTFAEREELEVRVKNFDMFDVPVLIIGQESFCPRDSTIHVFDATTNGAVSYLWSTMDTTPTLSVDMAEIMAGETAEYSVIVTLEDRICYTLCDTGAVSKTDFPIASIGIDPSRYCPEHMIDFQARSTTDLGGGVLWNTGETTTTITVSADHIEIGKMYSVTITDNCGDTSEATITVPDLRPPTGVDIVIDNSALCEQGVLFLEASWGAPGNPYGPPFTYLWNTDETTEVISVSTPGTYSVTITDICDEAHVVMGSIDIADQLIIPDPIISIVKEEIESRAGVCGVELNAVLNTDAADAIPNITYVTGGDVNTTLFVTELATDPQTFNATVSRCGEDFETTITLTSADLDPEDPTVTVTQSLDPLTCEVVLIAIGDTPYGPGTYSWSNNVLSNQSTVTEPGTYMVTFTDECGQSVVGSGTPDFTDIGNFAPRLETTLDTTDNCTTMFAVVDAPNGSVYEWSTGQSTSAINVEEAGDYSVTVTLCGRQEIFAETISEADDFRWPNIFFPQSRDTQNPKNRSFGPEVSCIEGKTGAYLLEVYNRWGKRVFETDNPAERWSGSLDNMGQPLEEDMYIYQWSYEGEEGSGHVTLIRN